MQCIQTGKRAECKWPVDPRLRCLQCRDIHANKKICLGGKEAERRKASSSVKRKAKTPRMIIESESEEQVDRKRERQDELNGFKDQLIGAIAMMQAMKLRVEKMISEDV
jgi:hypothetical protein